MIELKLTLLGQPKIHIDNKLVSSEMTTKGEALFIYLVLNRVRTHSREKLAELFWSDCYQANMRYNLRYTFWVLKKCLGSDNEEADYINMIGKDECQFVFVGKRLWIDIEEFEMLAKKGMNPLMSEKDSIGTLEKALNLYQGGFLDGFYAKASTHFEDWVFFERERLQRIYFNLLLTLARLHAAGGDTERGIECLKILLASNPLQEDVHRELIKLYALSGNRMKAIQQYESCCKLLRRELNISPMNETEELYYEITQKKQNESRLTIKSALNSERLIDKKNRVCKPNSTEWTSNCETLVIEESYRLKLDELIASRKAHSDDTVLLLKGVGYQGGNIPFEGVRQILDAALLELTDMEKIEVEDIWVLFPEFESIKDADRFEGHYSNSIQITRLYYSIYNVLTKLANKKCITVLFDNIQWVDEESLKAFYHLSHQDRKKCFLLAAIYSGTESSSLNRVLDALRKERSCIFIE